MPVTELRHPNDAASPSPATKGRGTRGQFLGPGVRIGSYVLQRHLGHGGFGEVWAARPDQPGPEVALKVLHRDEIAEVGGPSNLDRFLAEGRVLQRLDHPNVVRVQDVLDLRPGPVAYVMDLLQGRSLFQLQTRIDLGSLLSIARQVAEALSFVHEQDILHRDVKPGNIFVCRDMDARGAHPVKLIDFGIAKGAGVNSSETSTGMLVGTLRAMPPEAIDRFNGSTEPLTGAVDQWGLGITLYRVIYGRAPFEGDTFLSLMRAIKRNPVRFDISPRKNYDIDLIREEIEALIRRLLAKHPAHRFASMREALSELQDLEAVILDGATLSGARTSAPERLESGVIFPLAIDIDVDDFEDVEEIDSDELVLDTVEGPVFPMPTVRANQKANPDTAPTAQSLRAVELPSVEADTDLEGFVEELQSHATTLRDSGLRAPSGGWSAPARSARSIRARVAKNAADPASLAPTPIAWNEGPSAPGTTSRWPGPRTSSPIPTPPGEWRVRAVEAPNQRPKAKLRTVAWAFAGVAIAMVSFALGLYVGH